MLITIQLTTSMERLADNNPLFAEFGDLMVEENKGLLKITEKAFVGIMNVLTYFILNVLWIVVVPSANWIFTKNKLELFAAMSSENEWTPGR